MQRPLTPGRTPIANSGPISRYLVVWQIVPVITDVEPVTVQIRYLDLAAECRECITLFQAGRLGSLSFLDAS